MNIYPVVLCRSSGLRLWPAMRRDGPKPFVRLADDLSAFESAMKCLGEVAGAHRPLVLCEAAHAGWVRRVAPAGTADILLEPGARDSAAAVAVAAAWVAARDSEGVLVVVPADHHIPDATSFARALEAAARAAEAGGVVTLGARPTRPSGAYGYIAPGMGVAGDVRAIRSFVDRPEEQVAKACMDAGYLWSTGDVICRADILLNEFRAHAPAILDAAQAAVATTFETPAGARLGDAFLGAPRTSFDDAILEKTGRALVLPISFRWSDLGARDAEISGAHWHDHDAGALPVAREREGARHPSAFGRIH